MVGSAFGGPYKSIPLPTVICQNWSNYAYHYSKLVVHNSSPPMQSIRLTSSPPRHHAYHENAHSPFAAPYWFRHSETGSTRSLVEIMVRIIRRSRESAIARLIFPIHPKPTGASALHHRGRDFWTQWGHQCSEKQKLFAVPDA